MLQSRGGWLREGGPGRRPLAWGMILGLMSRPAWSACLANQQVFRKQLPGGTQRQVLFVGLYSSFPFLHGSPTFPLAHKLAVTLDKELPSLDLLVASSVG